MPYVFTDVRKAFLSQGVFMKAIQKRLRPSLQGIEQTGSVILFFSPAAGQRWIHWPPSAVLCAKEPDQSSPYAQQITEAHEFCAFL